MGTIATGPVNQFEHSAQWPVKEVGSSLKEKLFAWWNSSNAPIFPLISGEAKAIVDSEMGEEAPGLLGRLKNTGATMFSDGANFVGKKFFAFAISANDTNIANRLLSLDKNKQLPLFSEAIVSIISSRLENISDQSDLTSKPGVLTALKNNALKNGFKNPAIRESLKYSIEQILANLACYSPEPKEGEEGQFLTNIAKNLSKILHPTEDPYERICAKLQKSSHENVISVLLHEINEKCEKIKIKLARKYKEESGLESQISIAFSNNLQQEIKSLLAQLHELNFDANKLVQMKESYNSYSGSNSPSALFLGDVQDDYCPLSESEWFHYEYSKIKSTPDFDAVASQILKAAGSSGFVVGSLKEYLAAFLQDFYFKARTASSFSGHEKQILDGKPEHQELKAGFEALLKSVLPVVIGKKQEQIIALIVKLLAVQGVNGVDPLWIENFVEALADSNDVELQNSLYVIAQCLVPRLTQMVEHLAAYKLRKDSNLLESALLNLIDLFDSHLKGKDNMLQIAIVSYDKDEIQAEAYAAYVAYINRRNIPAKEKLAKADLFAILKGWNKEKTEALIASFPEEKRNQEYLLSFFQFEDGKHARNKQEITLLDAFGPLAQAFLQATGLNQDALIGFGAGDDFKLDDFRRLQAPKILMEIYRIISGPKNSQNGSLKMGQVIQDFAGNLSQRLEGFRDNPAMEEKLENYEKLILELTKGSKLSPAVIKIFAQTLSRVSSSWLIAIHNALDSQKFITEAFHKKLEVLDPKDQLPVISKSLSKVGFKILDEELTKGLQQESRRLGYWNLLIDACRRRDHYLANAKVGTKAKDLTEADVAKICAGNYGVEIFGAISMFYMGNELAPGMDQREQLVKFFKRANTTKLAAEKAKKSLNESPLLAKAYAALSNRYETAEFQPYVELILSKTIHRILTNLACSCEDTNQNGLLSNILKSLVAVINFGEEVPGKIQKSDLEILAAVLEGYRSTLSSLQEVTAELKAAEEASKAFHANFAHKNVVKSHAWNAQHAQHAQAQAEVEVEIKNLRIERSKRQALLDAQRVKISEKILAKAGFIKPADLHLILLPFGNTEFIENEVWQKLLEKIPEMLIELCDGLKYNSLLTNEKKAAVEALDGYEELQNDSKSMSAAMMPILFTQMASASNRSKISYAIKDFLASMGIEGLERAWIDELLTKMRQGADDANPQDAAMRSLWQMLEFIIAPRLFGAMENAALHENARGSLFERIVVNSTHVIKSTIDGHQPSLDAGLKKIDEWSLMLEACEWRNRYLQEIKGVKSAECDAAARNLQDDDIEAILKLYVIGHSSHEIELKKDQNYSVMKIWQLKNALMSRFNPNENIGDLFRNFFTEIAFENLKDNQSECLFATFGPCADQVLKLTGFTTDEAFSLFKADFKIVREFFVPFIISMLYRDMSDFKGLHARNNKQLEVYFGENKEFVDASIKVFTKTVSNLIKGYLKENGTKDAQAALNLFLPSSAPAVHRVIQRTAQAKPEENGNLNLFAMASINQYVENLVHANLVHVFTVVCDNSELAQKNSDEGSFGTAAQFVRDGGKQFTMKVSTIVNYLTKAPDADHDPVQLLNKENERREEEIRVRKELAALEVLRKKEIPSVLLSNLIIRLGGIFTIRRESLKNEMARIRPQLIDLQELAKAEKWAPEKLQAERAKLTRHIFLDISHELIELSGLTAKNLYCPEGVQNEIWTAITDNLVPDLLSQFYIDLTAWEVNREEDKIKFIANNIPSGPKAGKAFAHFAVRFAQSKLAIDGGQTGANLFDSVVEFFEGMHSVEGGIIVNLLHEKRDLFNSIIDKNLSQSAKAAEMIEVWNAIEAYLEPIIDKAILGLTENLNAIEANHPDCLKEMARDSILVATEHFKKLRAVALSHNVANAYELTFSELMKGMTLDGIAHKYVFLEEKVKQARIKRNVAQQELVKWRLISLNEAERAEFEAQKVKAEEELKAAKVEKDVYLKENWQDGGLSIKKYLSAERCLTVARKRLDEVKKRSKATWFSWRNQINDDEVRVAENDFRAIQSQLVEAKSSLKSMCAETVITKPKDQLIDLFSDDIYISYLEQLEGDLTDEERIKLQKEMEDYSIASFFKPFVNELLSLINEEQFEEIPFLRLLGEVLKKESIQKGKNKLPEVMYQIFEILSEPTTFLSLFNSVLDAQATSSNSPDEEILPLDDALAENDDFDQICGQLVMAVIDLMPSKMEEAIFMLTRVKGATQEAAGKVVGTQLRKFIRTHTLPSLVDKVLSSSVTAMLPEAHLDANGELVLGKNLKLPQTPEEQARAMQAKALVEEQLFNKARNGSAAPSEEIVQNTIRDKINALSESLAGLTSSVIKSVLSEQMAEKLISALKAFTAFIYNVVSTLIAYIAIPFLMIFRWLILAPKSTQVAKAIASKGHKRLLFQLSIIWLEIFRRERLKIAEKIQPNLNN